MLAESPSRPCEITSILDSMMKNRSRWKASLFHFINAFCLIILPIFGVIGTIDQIVARAAPTPVRGGTQPQENGTQRVFAILVDSLPYSLAVNPQLMPKTHALLREATYGCVTSVAEAVTSPAIWSAFTGRVDYRILDILRNFGAGDYESSSLFSQLQGLKKRVVIYSDQNSFKPFTQNITQLIRNDIWEDEADAKAYQNQQAQEALEAFRSGHTDLMIYHVTYLDSFAHKFHSSESQYQDAVRNIDGLIAIAAQQIGPDQTLIVFGDHGHTAEGRHLSGLDVPTIFIARGPAFEKEVLDNFHISRIRFLFSKASGLGLAAPTSGSTQTQRFDPNNAYACVAIILLVLLGILAALWMAFEIKDSNSRTSRREGLAYACAWTSGPLVCCFGIYPGNLLAALAMSVTAGLLLPAAFSSKMKRVIPIMLASGLIMALGYFFGAGLDEPQTLDSAAPRTSHDILMLTTFALPAFAAQFCLAQRTRQTWPAATWFIPAVLATLALWTMDLPMKDSLGVMIVLALGGWSGRKGGIRLKTASFTLLFLALAWFSCRWSLKNFKWQFIYQILHPKIVEDQVLWLVPLIGIRYALLTAALKMLIFDRQDDRKGSRLISRAFVALVLALVMLALGTGFHYPEFQTYLSVLLILGAFLCLGLGLIAVPISRKS
jgi:hypothetical protein